MKKVLISLILLVAVGCHSPQTPSPLGAIIAKVDAHVPAIKQEAELIKKDPETVKQNVERADNILYHADAVGTASGDMRDAEDAYAKERAMWRQQLDAEKKATKKAEKALEDAKKDSNQQASQMLLRMSMICFGLSVVGLGVGVFLKIRIAYTIAAVLAIAGSLFLGLQQALWWLRVVPLVCALAVIGYLVYELAVRKKSFREIVNGVQDFVEESKDGEALKKTLAAKQSPATKKAVAVEKANIKNVEAK